MIVLVAFKCSAEIIPLCVTRIRRVLDVSLDAVGVVIDYGICIAEIGRGLYDLALRDGKALLRALQMIAHQAAGDGQRGRQHGERNDGRLPWHPFSLYFRRGILIIHNASPFLHIVFRL